MKRYRAVTDWEEWPDGAFVRYEDLESAERRAEALEAECGRLRWFILAHKPKSGYDLDHACAECVPGGEMIQQDWRCGFHLALAPQAGGQEQTPPEAQGREEVGRLVALNDKLRASESRLIEECYRLRQAIKEHRLAKWGDLPVDKPHDVRLYSALAPQAGETPPEPGQTIARGHCPACGVSLSVEHGDDPGEVAIISHPGTETPPEAQGREEVGRG